MKKGLLFMFVQLLGIVSWAQIPAGYYSTATGLTGNDLKVALHNIIKGHQSVGYSGLWAAYYTTDVTSNNKIWDIYSNCTFTPGNSQCGNYSKEGDCYNREHTWPQSWFNEASTPKADLFHVYPTDGKVNGIRSNYPYGKVGTATYTSTNGSKLGNCVTDGYSGTVFEPADEYKGDIARSYFYMRVRYYSEDSGWSSSEMTTKSVIKNWAMNMLLAWSDEDPVSQKEIDRNNAVYGKQGNRNPFIDHPEYARMIWDANYTAATSYTITKANVLHGTISVSASAPAGTTVSLVATPDAGYELDSWTVYKTGDETTTVAVTNNGTFVMPEYNVTVSATFRQNTTMYTVTCDNNVENGTISVSSPSALSGTTITLTATPDDGYSLYSWYVYKTGDMNTTVTVTDNKFIMPSYDVTVAASFAQGSAAANGDYVKVTSANDLTSGQYLIVYEGGNKAFNGALTTLDAANNYISVTISDNTIASDATTDAAAFTIDMTAGTIKSASGYYIGLTANDNKLSASTSTAYTNTITYNSGNVDIVGSGGAYLRYNSQSGQARFRFFKSSTYTSQQPIQLYKRTSTVMVPTHTITFHNGTETKIQTVNENEQTALEYNTFTNEGYVFDGWLDSNDKYYADGATVSLLHDLDLYAQWNYQYSITCNQPEEGGIISADVSEAVEDKTVTLTAIPDEGYQFYRWNVTYIDEENETQTVHVTNNQFDMPRGNVTVSAAFVFVGIATATAEHYELVTSTDQLVAGNKYLIVNTAANKALSTTQNNNNRGAANVTISNKSISEIGSDVQELTLGGSTGAWTFYTGSGYLYAASSSNNYLKTQATNNANGQWAITVTSAGVASLTAQGSNSRNLLKYNSNDNLFSCYASGQQNVALFVKVDAVTPTPTVIFADDGSNAELLSSNNNTEVNAIIYGRTLYQDNCWNTLCLPFSLTATQVENLLNPDKLMTLSSTAFNSSTGTLTLNFESVAEIVAGKPYIIKWTSGSDITDLRFTDVTIARTTPNNITEDHVTFTGTFSPVTLEAGDKSVLYLTANNYLYYPGYDMTIGAFRAYFKLSNEIIASTPSGTNAKELNFVLNFGDEATGINVIDNGKLTIDNVTIYDLQGRKINGRLTIDNGQLAPGVYIVNGKKVIVK